MVAEAALFFTAFGAATLLPLSSEAAFVVALSNDMPLATALLFASCGNILAVIFNYALGYYLYKSTKERLHSSKIGSRAYSFGHRYGYYALLLSWLPLVGDPLTIVAGLLRLHFVWFVVIVALLRVARYYIIGLML